jgi:hypothetical protein
MPDEAWRGRKPKVTTFKVFDCLAYAHVLDTDRHKLEAKSRKCIFIRYNTKSNAYKLYDLVNRKVVRSRDVLFDEKPPHAHTFE